MKINKMNKLNKTMQLQEKVPWIDSLNINYHIGVDGLSMPLILITTLLSLLVIFS